jgi:replication factor C subunit 3/5
MPRYSEKVTDKTPVPPPDWEELVAQIADDILAEHTPARILQVRAKLYDLLSHCIPPTTILKVVLYPRFGLHDGSLTMCRS